MKKYFPIVIGILVIVGAFLFIRQFRAAQQVTNLPSLDSAAPATTGGADTTPAAVSTTPYTINRATGISLTVSSPANNTTVSSASLMVRGKTVAGAEVFVNDAETTADASGNFSVSVNLDEGENYILVVVNDAAGNYSEKELTVIYAP